MSTISSSTDSLHADDTPRPFHFTVGIDPPEAPNALEERGLSPEMECLQVPIETWTAADLEQMLVEIGRDFPRLRELDFTFNPMHPFQNVSALALAQLRVPRLETLTVSSLCCFRSPTDVRPLAETLREHVHLQRLSLNIAFSRPPVRTTGPEGEEERREDRLSARFIQVSLDPLHHLLESLTTLPHLAHVELHQAYRMDPTPPEVVTEEGALPPPLPARGIQDPTIWARLLLIPRLQDLCLRNWGLTDQDVISLAESLQGLSRTRAGDIATTDTRSSTTGSQLQTLDLRFNDLIGSQGLAALLQVLQTNTVLRFIYCTPPTNPKDPSFQAMQEQVDWLLLLNRHGRAFLQLSSSSSSLPAASSSSHPDGRLQEFVQVLQRADGELDVIYYFCRNCPQFFYSTAQDCPLVASTDHVNNSTSIWRIRDLAQWIRTTVKAAIERVITRETARWRAGYQDIWQYFCATTRSGNNQLAPGAAPGSGPV